ncbi:MAG: xylan 1,4-beta-xylosidase [Oscillospiraceae bacterium]|nr:xylan 1,4-beta-xylosidase [Oscillospiraceae bacterium]
MVSKINISKNDKVDFNNNATVCIGTGRMNLALRHEYHNQLAKVQKDIGFKYIRGHGLFCDDMGIYNRYEEDGVFKTEYNFRYVDMVFDDYLSMGLKPFIEFGFMPNDLASGEETIFWWKGNITPPSDYDEWSKLIKATVNHWIKRYGIDEVLTWPMEVWNEPNLEAFWKNADMQEYFKLYEVSAKAVKECDPRIRVGGPAICGVEDELWLKSFLEFTSKNNVPIDFVTRHSYATAPADYVGHYAYQKLNPLNYIPDELNVSREIIDSFPAYKGMEMHITEYNTSYSPRNPIHDNNLNATYIAHLLNTMGDTCASYSYWTFGDVFEEQGIAFTPFSGCFGLLTNGMIPKPTYWTYVFFSKLYNTTVSRGENHVVTKNDDDNLHGIAWVINEDIDLSDEHSFEFLIEVENGEYAIIMKTVDENVCNPLKTWHDLGSPAYPSEDELTILRECANPLTETGRITVSSELIRLNLTLENNAICSFEIRKINPETDRGYDIDRAKRT